MNEQSLKDRLKVIAREKAIPFNSCWKQLILERFLARLSRSDDAHRYIFKGGFLLAYLMEINRETLDLDFLLHQMQGEEQTVAKSIGKITQIAMTDGFRYDFANIGLLDQPHMNYSGFRITLDVGFGKIKDRINLDLGIGDRVRPENVQIQAFTYKDKPLFEEEISLLVYPIESIFAEKLETAVYRGGINSRMKDFHDLYLMSKKTPPIDYEKLVISIIQTFERRKTPTVWQLAFDQSELLSLQKLWRAHLLVIQSYHPDHSFPKDFSLVVEKLNSFLFKVKLEVGSALSGSES